MQQKFKKVAKSNRGSTMIMVIAALAVLSLLGTVILSIALMNVKMKAIDMQSKKSFYLAEAGLEEAYALIQEELEKAVGTGNKAISDNLQTFLEAELAKEDSEYLDDQDAIQYSKLESKLKEWFEAGYTGYVNTKLIASLEAASLSIVDADTGAKAELLISEDTEFSSENRQFKFYINSILNKDNHTPRLIKKELRTQFVIGIPTNYSSPFYIANETVKLNRNVLWGKTLATEKNIYIKGNNVKASGEVYAYGKAEGDDPNGGIAIGWGGKRGSFQLNKGTVVTNRYLTVASSNSTLDIFGDVYCNTLGIQDSVDSGTIKVFGNVNTEDDIELDGVKSTIDIQGSYYGFSDGTDYVSSHDSSSSIVINSDDIGSGSSISITGQETEGNAYENGVFIGGTVYIGLDTPFQTGESISIKGNYIAYSRELDGLTGEDAKYNKDNIIFEDFSPLILANTFKDTGNKLLYSDKSRYIYLYNQLTKDNPMESLNLGGPGIDIKNVIYSLGTYIDQGEMSSSKVVLEYENTIRKNKVKDYKFRTNSLSDPILASDTHSSRKMIKNDEANAGRFSFGADILPSADTVNLKKEILLVNTSNKSLVLIGPGGSLPEGLDGSSSYVYNLNNEQLKGVILTKGKVYISGSLNYKGMLAAVESINILDDNPKSFANDEQFVMKMVLENTSLKSQFVNNGEAVKFIYKSEAAAKEEGVSTYYNLENLIQVRSWTQK